MPHQPPPPPPGSRLSSVILDSGTLDQVPIVVSGQPEKITVFIPDFFVRGQRIIATTPPGAPTLFSMIVQPISNNSADPVEKSTIEQVILENFEPDPTATGTSTRLVFRRIGSAPEHKVIIRYSHP
jgi:hypothetical protein